MAAASVNKAAHAKPPPPGKGRRLFYLTQRDAGLHRVSSLHRFIRWNSDNLAGCRPICPGVVVVADAPQIHRPEIEFDRFFGNRLGVVMAYLNPMRRRDIIIASIAGLLAWVITCALKTLFSG